MSFGSVDVVRMCLRVKCEGIIAGMRVQDLEVVKDGHLLCLHGVVDARTANRRLQKECGE